MEHNLVYYEPGKFGGWPANGGAWSWGEEILVCFHLGEYLENPRSHAIDRSKPIRTALARSPDGGETWTVETDNPIQCIDEEGVQPVPEEGLNFGHPDFALKVGKASVKIVNSRFVVSYDRGRSWEGPYPLPQQDGEMTARTSYLVTGPRSCLLFLSQNVRDIDCVGYSDRAFAAGTEDGGRTWEFMGHMTDDDPRSVMPSTVQLADGRLVAALRRRRDILAVDEEEAEEMRRQGKRPPAVDENWIEIRGSTDGGRTWEYLAKGADTNGHNGNPPAMVALPDGRLALAYGYRGDEPAIKARISGDGGRTWGEEIILRSDARMHDIGYPRMLVRPDGKVVTVYYYTTEEMPEQHIEATIWKP